MSEAFISNTTSVISKIQTAIVSKHQVKDQFTKAQQSKIKNIKVAIAVCTFEITEFVFEIKASDILDLNAPPTSLMYIWNHIVAVCCNNKLARRAVFNTADNGAMFRQFNFFHDWTEKEFL